MNHDVESAVLNGGYSTNYFKVSRGVRQGSPLSPLLFVLGVEVMAQKVRQSPECRGIKLPQSTEAKISQFADDTTLISLNFIRFFPLPRGGRGVKGRNG